MSAALPPAPPPPPPPPRLVERNEVTIVGHSSLIYWWPVWAVGFLMAFLTWLDHTRMVTVPRESEIAEALEVKIVRERTDSVPDAKTQRYTKKHDVVILPEGRQINRDNYPELNRGPTHPKLQMSHRRGYG